MVSIVHRLEAATQRLVPNSVHQNRTNGFTFFSFLLRGLWRPRPRRPLLPRSSSSARSNTTHFQIDQVVVVFRRRFGFRDLFGLSACARPSSDPSQNWSERQPLAAPCGLRGCQQRSCPGQIRNGVDPIVEVIGWVSPFGRLGFAEAVEVRFSRSDRPFSCNNRPI